MKIRDHRLCHDDDAPVTAVLSPNQGGALNPRYLVMHYTAGGTAESAIRHLTRAEAKASAHLVIARDGTITQLVPFDRVAWHAGRSQWHGLSGLNQHAIGIELDNAGPMDGGPGQWHAWFGRSYPDDEVVVAAHKFDGVARGWHRYSEAQLAAALAAAESIVSHYGLIDVLGHDDIAPGRKQDPGPAFPMRSFASRLVGRADDHFERFRTATELNLREGPGIHFPKHAKSPLAKDTLLRSQARDGSWHAVDVLDGNGEPQASGWVHGNYLVPAQD